MADEKSRIVTDATGPDAGPAPVQPEAGGGTPAPQQEQPAPEAVSPDNATAPEQATHAQPEKGADASKEQKAASVSVFNFTLKTGSPDLGPSWPEAWRKTKGRHRSLGAVLLCFPTETMREICWQSTHFEKEASMVQSVTYQSETKTVPFQGKTIVLESLTPVLSPKEKEKRKKEIERCLYEVFSKYRLAGDKRH